MNPLYMRNLNQNEMDNLQFEDAYKAHFDRLLFQAKRYTGDIDDAKDLLQSAVLHAFEQRSSLNDIQRFYPWMARIVHHTYLNAYQKAARRRTLLMQNGSSDAFFYNQDRRQNEGYWSLVKEDIQRLAQEIGERSYEAFALFVDGYSYFEIADMLNIAMGTVKSRINFLRNKFKLNSGYNLSPAI